MTDPAQTLAQHACHTTYDNLSEDAIRASRRDLLDTLGAMLGGSNAPGIDNLVGLVRRWGGIAESHLLLVGVKSPAPQAAWVNAAMGHALDYDDTYDRGGSIHPGVSTLAAAFATADMRGGVSGREFLLAITLGLDVSCRLALAATLERGWHRTSAIGIFGATAAAGKLLGLNPTQLHHAFGIAYSQAAGNRQCILDGSLTKRLQAGQAASGAVLSALLARDGFTGADGVFAGQLGFYRLYQPQGYDLEFITEGLGVHFLGTEVSFKPYPCGRNNHALLDAALSLHQQLGLHAASPADIAEVTVRTNPAAYERGLGTGAIRRPTQVVEAQFSLPFLLATALLKGGVKIADVATVTDAPVLALADRVSGTAQEDAPPGWARLSIRLRDGRHAEQETGVPSGAPENPLSDAQLEAKFRDCAAHARRPLADEQVDHLLATVSRMEEIADITTLMHLLA